MPRKAAEWKCVEVFVSPWKRAEILGSASKRLDVSQSQ